MGNFGGYNALLQRIARRGFGGYQQGVDWGIKALGREVESGIHNWGTAP